MDLNRLYHVQRADEIEPIVPEALGDRASGLRRATLVGRHVGSVHTGFALVELDPDGRVDTHVHSTEQSFYVLERQPEPDRRRSRLPAGRRRMRAAARGRAPRLGQPLDGARQVARGERARSAHLRTP